MGPVNTVRTFIAIELDPQLRAYLSAVQEDLGEQVPSRSIRWVRPDGIHLTLKFLGDTPLAAVERVKAALAQAACQVEPFTFAMGSLGCFPNARRPRVVWISLLEPSGSLSHLRDAVESKVTPLGFPTENRPFSPHLTLGRVQRHASSADVRRVGQVVMAALPGRMSPADPGWDGGPGREPARRGTGAIPVGGAVTAVSYIKSDLRPSGAVYTTLYDAHLGAK